MFKYKRPLLLRSTLVLAVLLPLSAGCPQLRNEAVTVIENATRDVVDRALDNAFDALRSNDF